MSEITFGREEIAKISLENFIYLSTLIDEELGRRANNNPCKSCGGRYCFECMWTGIEGYRIADGIVTHDIIPALEPGKRSVNAVVQVPKEEYAKDMEFLKESHPPMVDGFKLRPATPSPLDIGFQLKPAVSKVTEPEVHEVANSEIQHTAGIEPEPDGGPGPDLSGLISTVDDIEYPSAEEVEAQLAEEFPPKVELKLTLVPEGVAVN